MATLRRMKRVHLTMPRRRLTSIPIGAEKYQQLLQPRRGALMRQRKWQLEAGVFRRNHLKRPIRGETQLNRRKMPIHGTTRLRSHLKMLMDGEIQLPSHLRAPVHGRILPLHHYRMGVRRMLRPRRMTDGALRLLRHKSTVVHPTRLASILHGIRPRNPTSTQGLSILRGENLLLTQMPVRIRIPHGETCLPRPATMPVRRIRQEAHGEKDRLEVRTAILETRLGKNRLPRQRPTQTPRGETHPQPRTTMRDKDLGLSLLALIPRGANRSTMPLPIRLSIIHGAMFHPATPMLMLDGEMRQAPLRPIPAGVLHRHRL